MAETATVERQEEDDVVFPRPGREENEGHILINSLPTIEQVADAKRGVRIFGKINITSFDEASETVGIHFVFNTLHPHELDHAAPDTEDDWVMPDKYEGFLPNLVFNDALFFEVQTVTFLNDYRQSAYTVMYGNATIKVRNNFRAFPFDLQVLLIELQSHNSKFGRFEWDSSFVRPEFEVCGIPTNWVMQNFITAFEDNRILFHIGIARKSRYYVQNYCFVTYLILVSNITVLGFDTSELADRNSITFTLFLTLTAFKYVIQDGIAKSDYLSYMDKYHLLAFLGMAVAALENVVVNNLGFKDPERVDCIFQYCLLVLWTIIFLGFVIVSSCPRLFRPGWQKVEDEYFKESYQYRMTSIVTDSVVQAMKHKGELANKKY